LWDFGDGTTSTLQNPTHIYASNNNYHVGLTITTASGCERTYVGFNAVTFTNYQASFTSSYNPTAPYPVAVSFTPQTPGATSWLWNFGDGTTSTLQNPVHTYATAGNYTVTLTVMANGCSHTVTGNPFAIPSQSGGNNGNGGSEPPTTVIPSQPFISCAPASISFFRQSPLHQIIQWSFGDGTFSTQTNPVKVYTSPGVYNVSYTATSPSGPVTITYPQSIHIGGFLPDIAVTTHSDCNTFYIATGLNNAALFDQVHWKFGNSAIYNGLNVNYQLPFTNGSVVIRAMVTDTLGCSAVSVQSILMNKPTPFVAYPTTVCRDSIQFEQLGSTSTTNNKLIFFVFT
jgi:PKD repeat protein